MKFRLFELIKQFAILSNPVILASGLSSEVYIDCRQFYLSGEGQYLLGEIFWQELLKWENIQKPFDACGGMAVGSIPLSCALSSAAFKHNRELPGVFVRKETKEHGTKAKIEGHKKIAVGSNILLMEDVVTSGASALTAATELRKHGFNVNKMIAIVDREQGGREALWQEGISLASLFVLSDFNKK